jgi:hypothetical protein
VRLCECQALNVDDANFCNSCGRPLAANDVADTDPSSVQNSAVVAKSNGQPRILRIIASFIAIALIVAVGLTVVLRNIHIEISSNNLVSVQLPLNVCKTSVGDSSDTPRNLPTTIKVDIAKGQSTNLAFYSDDEGVIEVLAPSGWNCTAAIGANGSSSVQVAPTGQSVVSSGALSAESTLEDVSASQTSACVGCRESLACPLFASAAKDLQAAYQQTCATSRPPSEQVTTINPHVVEFTDPPGINGDADPSGGAYAARGVMTYFDDFQSDGSWTETCLLPATGKSTCKAIIGDFVTRYGAR